ncbi:hypothetical protein [Phaeobacter inhibens]|uniref:hypothetical protein n=1 Tax=Phaeobacter inhibens TaxID=221822 RepID=UPI000C9B8A1E|nr:hypothetical protein [Phaeobacter inhibens]AUQ62342.1 hypothetical protein PhaeoP51_01347 [Phaeobacter inhibens]AUQ91336.1 hypothetical protein PhaeoP24_02746 [Phaeobacter inhibens]
MNLQRISLQVAEKLREIATRQGNVPFDKGDLRKAHVVEPSGTEDAILAANTPYARAVHDGRPALTIKPKRKKALAWKGGRHPAKSVKQPARKGNPWLARAVDELEREGLDFLAPELGQDVADELTDALRARGLAVRQR